MAQALADHYVRPHGEDEAELDLIVDGMHCAGCMNKIEKGLGALDGITYVRANLSTKRVAVRWQRRAHIPPITEKLSELGFEAVPYDPQIMGALDEEQGRDLLRATGVAGFAAANVMLLSVSVWSGLVSDMEVETRALFHWISALIALPAVAYAGQPFFKSAFKALKAGHTNMDVPISLAVILSAGMSLVQTITHAEHAYFDASVSLLFFLLIGRYLDVKARSKACSVAQNLLALRAVAANVIMPDGTISAVPVDRLDPGMKISVASGMRLPADGVVLEGVSDIDKSLVTGETVPETAAPGTKVFAGTMNLGAALTVRVTARNDETLLAEIVRLMEAAEQGRAGYVRLADRVSRYYAPAVHALAAATLLLWLALGAGWQTGLINAVAVLIITCPCALALAVPIVQVVATGRLLQRGILVKSSDGLEKLADIDTVFFDKTGTLTEGKPELCNREEILDADLSLAGALAARSKHPLSEAMTRAAAGMPLAEISDLQEHPGLGLSATWRGQEIRLGKKAFALEGLAEAENAQPAHSTNASEFWLSGHGAPCRFLFTDRLRPDAEAIIHALQARGLPVKLLSGDREEIVAATAKRLAITDWQGECTPQQKIAALKAAEADGKRVLMIGDGLNDAPCLKAAYVSMSPASAADISQTAADFIFQGQKLAPVLEAVRIARISRRLVLQNFGLSFAYNAVAIPLAVMGFVTPLIAAVAMSASSLSVIGNALRLNLTRFQER